MNALHELESNAKDAEQETEQDRSLLKLASMAEDMRDTPFARFLSTDIKRPIQVQKKYLELMPELFDNLPKTMTFQGIVKAIRTVIDSVVTSEVINWAADL